MEEKKLLFVYNPFSGRGVIKTKLSDIIEELSRGGYLVSVHPTTKKGDGLSYIREHIEEYDMIVTAGGDGMLNEMFNGIISSHVVKPCGYIPTGTANDFASSMNIPKKPIDAAKIICDSNLMHVDTGYFNDKVFAYIAAFGVFTELSYDTDQKMKNLFGYGAYIIELLQSMNQKYFNERSAKARIEINNKVYEGDFIFGMAGNTHSIGTIQNGFLKNTRMDDGLLDFVFIKTPKNLLEMQKVRNALLLEEYNIPEIIVEHSDQCKIEFKNEVSWTLDGEFGGNVTDVDIKVSTQGIHIKAPKVM